ncbi:MAG TPA: hypothetical protein PKY86_10025 [Niabella sp.]|nr:hypothetical protein [Niabella sp.]HQW14886.1 hypothetical protein [Niabella sp.]HQX18489.1 hypothetical protein [Niabella sp.]HQX41487.1 hypothetical protein [Niabella sp.]HRB06016.1 hypothetical protein [Niabella sp.]
MHTSFVKIIHFSRLVKIEDRLREFNFKKNNNAGDYVFDVDTANDRGNRIFFRMQRTGNEWSASSEQPMPEWVQTHLDQLVMELEEGVQTN